MALHPPELSRQQWSLFERSAFRVLETDSFCLRLHNPLILRTVSVTKAKEWSLFVAVMFMCFVGAIGEQNVASSWHPQCLNDPASTLLFFCWLLSLTRSVLFFFPLPAFLFPHFYIQYEDGNILSCELWRAVGYFFYTRQETFASLMGIMSVAFVYLFWGS